MMGSIYIDYHGLANFINETTGDTGSLKFQERAFFNNDN